MHQLGKQLLVGLQIHVPNRLPVFIARPYKLLELDNEYYVFYYLQSSIR